MVFSERRHPAKQTTQVEYSILVFRSAVLQLVNGGVSLVCLLRTRLGRTTCGVSPRRPRPAASCCLLTSTTSKSILSDNMQRFMASITHMHKIHYACVHALTVRTPYNFNDAPSLDVEYNITVTIILLNTLKIQLCIDI